MRKLYREGSIGEILAALCGAILLALFLITLGAFSLAKHSPKVYPFISIAIGGHDYKIKPYIYCTTRLTDCYLSEQKYELNISPGDIIIISIPEEISRNPCTKVIQMRIGGQDTIPQFSLFKPNKLNTEIFAVQKEKFPIAFEIHLPSIVYTDAGLLSRAFWAVNFNLRR